MISKCESTPRKKATKLRASSKHGIPREIRGRVKGRVIDLSGAHEYSRRVWDAVRPRLKLVLTDLGQNRYELAPGFFLFFTETFRKLPDAVRLPGPNRTVGDVAVQALFQACMTYGVPQSQVFRGPHRLWPEDRPISEAWRSLGELPVPGEGSVVFEDPGPGRSLQIPKSDRYLCPRIGLRVHFNKNKNELPKLTIEIEGEQTCLLMKPLVHRSDVADEERSVRNDAKRFWDPIFKELKVMLEIEQPREGRPQQVHFEEAAYLKYHDNLFWHEVAERLCPINHTHSKGCTDQLKSGVRQFFKRLRRNALALPPVTK